MTAKTKHSHFPISKSGSRMGGSCPDLDIPPTVGQGPQSSTPYCASNAALNQTFDVSQISYLVSVGVHQDTAVIAVEVSLATAPQASKEF